MSIPPSTSRALTVYNANRTSASNAGQQLARKSPLAALLSLGAIAAAGWMIKDSFVGSKPIWDQDYDEAVEHVDLEHLQYGMGHYSGNPGMDGWASKLKRLTLEGPFKIKLVYERARIYIGGFLNDVVMQNLIPIGVAVTGMYATFGAKALHKPFKEIYRTVAPHLKKFRMNTDLLGGASRLVGRGIVKVGGFAARNPVVAAMGVALGLFGLNRLDRSYGHEGQNDFFRNDIWTKGH